MNIIKEIKNEFMRTLQLFAGISGDTAEAKETPAEEANEKTYSPNEISLSDRVVGSKVELINPDGSLTVAPDGDYQVDDFEFTVKDGLISAIEGQKEPVDEQMAETPAPQPNPYIEALKAEIATIKEQVTQLVNAMSGLNDTAATKDDVKKFQSVVETLNSNMMKLAKLPAEPSKTNNTFEVKNENNSKLEEFAKMLNSKK